MNEEAHTENELQHEGLSAEEEAALIEACAAGDPAAWRRLVDAYGPRVYTGIRYFLRSYRESMVEEDALNIYQEMFLDLCRDDFRRLRTFLGGGRLATWLFTIARRQCLDYIRDSSRKKRVFPKLAGPEILDLAQPLSVPADPAAAGEATEAVLKALDQLNSRNRLLIVLFHFEDLSYEEISKITGISKNSVSDMLRKARESLGKILEE